MRSTSEVLSVFPLVSPSGQFVFSPIAANVRDGLTHVENVDGEDVASVSKSAEKRGYLTIEQVADNPKQAEDLRAGLMKSYHAKGGHERIPAHLLPSKVKEMRARKARKDDAWAPAEPAVSKPKEK